MRTIKLSFAKCFVAEIDEMIKGGNGVDIFSLHHHIGYEHDGEVKPLYSTYSEPCLVFLLQIVPENGEKKFINIFCGDGGTFVYRSELLDDISELMFETEEGWVEL